jgi:iron complex outermembrane receptor protein
MNWDNALRTKVGLRHRLAGASVAVLATVAALPATAQDEATATSEVETVVVTASRIKTGFEAPTPVTVVTAQDLQNSGVTNIADYLNELPSFSATVSPTSTSLASRTNGSNYVDLRGIGPNRTLVLIDGRRHVATTSEGAVNLNVVPSMAIERMEVVTGGASAAWGSDAVAGVVNLILDDKLEGFRGEAQYGIASEGDGITYRAGGAIGGHFADDRGHFMIATEYEKDEGVLHQSDRDWGRQKWGIIPNPADTGPNDGIPARLITKDVNLFIGTEGGLILGPGPIAFIKFGPGGTLEPFNPGSVISPPFSVGGDGANMGQYAGLSTPYERFNILGRSRYKLNDKVEAYFEGSYAHSASTQKTVQSFNFPAVIRADNAFIPAGLQTLLDANHIPAFGLYRVNTDLGFITADSTYDTYRTVMGLRGDLNSDWSWDAYYEYGRTDFENRQLNNRIEANFANAIDAVVDPISGNTVCRATLSGQAPGCVPLNLFGKGSPSQAAIDYVNGTGFLSQEFTQHVFSASAQGKLFDLPAGAVSLAFGAEHREDGVKSQADDISQNDGFLIVNAKPVNGSYSVNEVFAETAVPLLRDVPLAKSLELNAAVRYTDYSTSGPVTTWKLGATWSPVEDLRFRGTLSRDIRAPNIAELFTSSRLSFTNVDDPVQGSNVFIKVLTQGNTHLKPEEADTKTLGAVYQPAWLPGLRLSADWYQIKIDGAINFLDPQTIINLCDAGNAALCSVIARDGTGTITQVTSQQFNIASLDTTGIDFELAYRTSLDEHLPAIGGSLTFRVLASYVQDRTFSPDGITKIQKAGDVDPNDINLFSVPHWRGSGSVTWERGPATLHLATRWVGEAKYNNAYTAEDINDNSVPSRVYFDVSGRYKLDVFGKEGLQVFAGVKNLFDRDPPPVPVNFIDPYATNPTFYDVIGRYFFFGVNAKF